MAGFELRVLLEQMDTSADLMSAKRSGATCSQHGLRVILGSACPEQEHLLGLRLFMTRCRRATGWIFKV